jgi:hypothetical protein
VRQSAEDFIRGGIEDFLLWPTVTIEPGPIDVQRKRFIGHGRIPSKAAIWSSERQIARVISSIIGR